MLWKTWKVRVRGLLTGPRSEKLPIPDGEYLMREVELTYGYELLRGSTPVAQLPFSEIQTLRRNGQLTVDGAWP